VTSERWGGTRVPPPERQRENDGVSEIERRRHLRQEFVKLLWRAVRIERDEVRERPGLDQLACFVGQSSHQ